MTRCRTTWRTAAWPVGPNVGNWTPAMTITGRTWPWRPPRLVMRPRNRWSRSNPPRSPPRTRPRSRPAAAAQMRTRRGAHHELAVTDAGDPAPIRRRIRVGRGPASAGAVGRVSDHVDRGTRDRHRPDGDHPRPGSAGGEPGQLEDRKSVV